MTPIFSNNIKNLQRSVQNITDVFATQKEYVYWKPHLNRIKWRKVTANKRNQISPTWPYMVKIRGILNARTMNVLSQEQGKSCIKSKL